MLRPIVAWTASVAVVASSFAMSVLPANAAEQLDETQIVEQGDDAAVDEPANDDSTSPSESATPDEAEQWVMPAEIPAR